LTTERQGPGQDGAAGGGRWVVNDGSDRLSPVRSSARHTHRSPGHTRRSGTKHKPAPPDDRNRAARRRILRAPHAVDGRAPSPITYRVAEPSDTVAFAHATGVPSEQYEPNEGASDPSPRARRQLSPAYRLLCLVRFSFAYERSVRVVCGRAGFVQSKDGLLPPLLPAVTKITSANPTDRTRADMANSRP